MDETIKDNLADRAARPPAPSSDTYQSMAEISDWWPDLVRTIIVQNCYKPIWNLMNNWRNWALGSMPMINPNLSIDPFSRLREAVATGLVSYARLCDPQLKNLNTLVQEGCEMGQKYASRAGFDLVTLLGTLRKAQDDDCAADTYSPVTTVSNNPAGLKPNQSQHSGEVEQSLS
ncbi:MAG: hypothetical protein HQK60_02620 [Deltaproteobacteria bacterium]|nr:hypothetical protein [Deltaproteobacteria bacterium]